jgi:hypothetical protein
MAVVVMIGASSMSPPATGADVDCPPTVVLRGPAALVAQLRPHLEARGVAIGARAGCASRAVNVTIEKTIEETPTSRRYQLHIEDAFGRTSDAEVDDLKSASGLIESWSVDADSDLLRVSARPAAPEPSAPDVDDAFTTSRRFGWMDGLGALGNDGSLSVGGGFGACLRVGPTCVGLKARALYDGQLGTQFADGVATRFNTDAFVVAGVPLIFRRLLLIPSIGIGGGWTHTRSVDFGQTVPNTVSDVGFRSELSVLGAVALTHGVAVGLEIAATWAAGATPGQLDPGPGGDIPAEASVRLLEGIACVWAP